MPDAATVFRTVAEGNRVAAQALLKRLKVHLNDSRRQLSTLNPSPCAQGEGLSAGTIVGR